LGDTVVEFQQRLTWLQHVVDVSRRIDLHDTAGQFAAHRDHFFGLQESGGTYGFTDRSPFKRSENISLRALAAGEGGIQPIGPRSENDAHQDKKDQEFLHFMVTSKHERSGKEARGFPLSNVPCLRNLSLRSSKRLPT